MVAMTEVFRVYLARGYFCPPTIASPNLKSRNVPSVREGRCQSLTRRLHCPRDLPLSSRVFQYPTPHLKIAETYLSCLNSREVKALSTSPTPDLQRALFLASHRVLLLTSNTYCFNYILLHIGPFRLHRIPYAYDHDNGLYPLKSTRNHRYHIFSILILVRFPSPMVYTAHYLWVYGDCS